MTGVVTPDGRLNLGGSSSFTDPDFKISGTVQIGGWDTNLSGPGAMTGRWARQLPVVHGDGPTFNEYREEAVTMTQLVTMPVERRANQLR